MKKITLILMFFALNYMAFGQCPPEDVVFESQQDINDFATNYPNCTEIQGDITIADKTIPYEDTDISSLLGLSQITVIHGSLSIGQSYYTGNPLLNSLTGLENLTMVGGSLRITGEQSFTNLNGLNGLVSIGNILSIYRLDELAALSGLENLNTIGGSLYLTNLNELTDITGLSGLTSIGGSLSVSNLAQLTSLTGLEGLNSVEYNLYISDCNTLADLNGLSGLNSVGWDLKIGNLSELTDLSGFNNLTTVGGCLEIGYYQYGASTGDFGYEAGNSELVNLGGFNNLVNLSCLKIAYNYSLETCNAPFICNYLQNGGQSDIHDNASGCGSAAEVTMSCQSDCPLGDIVFTLQQEVNDFAANYPNCTEIDGTVVISNASNLNSLSQIERINGSLYITYNSQLTDLAGLEGLISIGGTLHFEYLDQLTSLIGLENLTTVGGNLTLGLLNGITDLTGLNSLNTIGGCLQVGFYFEDDFDTSSFPYEAGNANLASLNGLDNLNSIGCLEIAYNPNLPICNAPFICNYLQTGGQGNIYDNAPGCNSTTEILNSCAPACTEQDSLALLALYNTTNGINWNTTWNLNAPISTWHGVTMSADGCNVQELNLSNNNLVGTISPEIGNLSALTRLLLHTNNLTGSISPEIANATELHQIWLFSNQLSGILPPEIGNLNQLTHLGLGGNQLTGSIPASYGDLSSLGFLALKNNNLSGCFDINLANICAAGINSRINSGNNFDALWTNFCTTDAGACTPPPAPTCRYTDSLALITLFQATNGPTWTTTWNPAQPMDTWYGITLNAEGCVAEINLAQNNLFGVLPPAIGDLTSMVRFNVHSNRLMGGIPAAIGNAAELRQIWVFNNELSGPLPEEIGGLTHLTHFGVGKNQLTGTIPASYGDLNNLTFFTLPQNQLSGCFDDNLANICSAAGNSNINSGNNFDALWSDFCTTGTGSCTGTPPLTCRYLDSLVLIDLYDATNGLGWNTQWDISQPIDAWHGVTLNSDDCVTEINLPQNNLTGIIPSSIDNLESLERLNLHTNNLSGNIPATIGSLNNLRQIWLFTNQLSGTLPVEIGNLTNLTHLGIGNNQLTGSIPASYGNLSNLGFLAIRSNNLSGCYDANLTNICSAGTDSRVSSGNNFSATWSSFCTNLAGCCNCRLDMSDNLVETEEKLINLYPNPANQFINIDLQIKNSDELNYVIYNTLGEIVQSGQIQGQLGTHQYSIELNDLNTGVYYFNLITGDKQTTKHFTVIR